MLLFGGWIIRVILLLLLTTLTLLGNISKNQKSFLILPVPFYTPTTEFGLAVTGIYVKKYHTPHGRELSDKYAFVSLGTSKKQFIGVFFTDLYYLQDRLHLNTTFSLVHYPQSFYGFGNNTLIQDEERYTARYARLINIFEILTLFDTYIGIKTDTAYNTSEDLPKGSKVEAFYNSCDRTGYISGAGIIINRDTRNSSLYPERGSLSTLSSLIYRPTLGSDYQFTRTFLNYRKFISIIPKHILAFEGYFDWITGNPPLMFYPRFGGQTTLRGYSQGRYLNPYYLAAQTAFRFPLLWRFGMVVFLGAGNVYPTLKKIDPLDLKYTGGAGIRFALKSKINMRLDFGFSEDGIKIYFNVLEAF